MASRSRAPVADRPGHDPVVGARRPVIRRRGIRHAAERRLEAEDPAERRGDPDRPGAVGTVGDGAEPGRDGGAGAARGGAGRAIEFPGVAAGGADQVVAAVLEPEIGRVGLAEEDGAGRLEPPRHDPVLGGHVLLEPLRSEGRPDVRRRLEILERIGDSVQGAAPRAAPGALLGGPCQRKGAVGGHREERVESGVEPVDAREQGARQLDRGDRAGPDQAVEIGGRREGEVIGVHGCSFQWGNAMPFSGHPPGMAVSWNTQRKPKRGMAETHAILIPPLLGCQFPSRRP